MLYSHVLLQVLSFEDSLVLVLIFFSSPSLEQILRSKPMLLHRSNHIFFGLSFQDFFNS